MVQRYVRESLLDKAAEKAARSSGATPDLEALVTEVARRLGRTEGTVAAAAAPQTEVNVAVASKVLEERSPAPVSEGAAAHLAEEAALQVAAAPAAAGLGPGTLVVENTDSQIWHDVLVGPPVFQAASSLTLCRWRFGSAGAARLAPRGDLPVMDWKRLCRNCFHDLRRDAKVQAARTLACGWGISRGHDQCARRK